MKKILILTASFGNGHNTAAYNVREALDIRSEDIHIEVVDVFKQCYGKTNKIVNSIFLKVVERFPLIWSFIYALLDRSALVRSLIRRLGKAKHGLADAIQNLEPDVIVTTYPAYPHLLDAIYKPDIERPFKLITVITDSLSINSVWFTASSDYFLVPNQFSADCLTWNDVPEEKIKVFGFPVHPRFTLVRSCELINVAINHNRKILYIINHGKKIAGEILENLLKYPEINLTITCGVDQKLKNELQNRFINYMDRVTIIGWTDQMPELLSSHDLVITKAGGAIVQEALAAGCPMIINQVIPGQESGNADLIRMLGAGTIALNDEDVISAVTTAFVENAEVWRSWKRNIQEQNKADAADKIAEFILGFATTHKSINQTNNPEPNNHYSTTLNRSVKKPLLCDFHSHTTYSDGQFSISELVDFYGQRNFDCICITDHVADHQRITGQLSNLSGLVLPKAMMEEYFHVIQREKKRAWKKYNMIVMAGLEFNKDGLSRKSSAHLLGIDLKNPIDPELSLKEIISEIHAQNGLAVASHPHLFESQWGPNTLYLWDHQNEFAPLLDAWEIANRYDLFNPVGLKKLPFIANSDFHKPKHIYTWKTLLDCEKDADAIKECVRRNVHVSITFYQDSLSERRDKVLTSSKSEELSIESILLGEEVYAI